MTIIILLNDRFTNPLCPCYGILLYVFSSIDTVCTDLIKQRETIMNGVSVKNDIFLFVRVLMG